MPRTTTRSNYILTRLLPAVLGTLLVIGGTWVFLNWSTFTIDRLASGRQRELVYLGVRNIREEIARSQESAMLASDAAANVQAQASMAWIDANLGTWMHDFYGIDEIYVLTGEDKPIYAYVNGAVRSPREFFARAALLRPTLAGLRRELRNGVRASRATHELTIGAVDFALINRRPAVVSVKPILAAKDDAEAPPAGQEYLHVSIRYMDDAFVKRLMADYLIDDLRFVWGRDYANMSANLPLTNSAGMTLGFYTWTPFRPGLDFVQSITPGLTAVSGLLFGVVLVLSLALYRRHVKGRENESRIVYLASHDMLTGLPNRMTFEQDADVLLEALGEDRSGGSVAVLYLDFDRFKQINDTLGHAAGDTVIRLVVARLDERIGGVGRLYRVGGDEFMVLMPDCRAHDVEALCQDLIAVVSEPVELDEATVFIGLSIGIAMAPLHGDDRTELVRKADVALYNAKASGRGRYSHFGPQMDALVRDRAVLEAELRRDIEAKRGFYVVYQPKFSGRDQSVVGVEALARWDNGSRGQVSPSVFIPIAEETGLIIQLGQFVLEVACRDAAEWPIDHVAVNVSVIQLREPGFVDMVMGVLRKHQLPPPHLEIELTESSWIDDAEGCKANLEALRLAGVRVALDDFGTGFSTFERLRVTNVDRIKIDQSFVGGFGKTKGDEAIVGAIVELARAKGLRTTAEGVETDEQREMLLRLGCDELQGFLLARPMPAGAIGALFRPKVVASESGD
jgi:diguanylate cyclase (GGDEF)-like protein